VTSIILSNGKTNNGAYNGVAPGVDLVAVRAFDAAGRATYADIYPDTGGDVRSDRLTMSI
jgi:serine protease AprX